ncbi:hypothetical protein F4818DRAFT_445140 [Hypoxylon cercidicola]|nr:hypothetical protein F4818DRAFT_445140 [Hypoxylon cercidicola]
MHFSAVVRFVAMAAPLFAPSASGWSFTAYDAEGCGSATGATADKVEKPGNVACEPVPNAVRHKSIQGAIPRGTGTGCRVDFYPAEGCGGRVAFSLTEYTTTCLSIADFFRPLAYYKASGCALAAAPDDFWSRMRADQDAREVRPQHNLPFHIIIISELTRYYQARVKDQLIVRLKENGVLSDEQMELFKRELVCHDDKRQSLRETRRRQREIHETFDKIHYQNFIRAVVKYIENHVPNDRCVQVYEDVVSIIPSSGRSAAGTVSPRETPETPFSVSRATPESAKSNAELIDILASTADLTGREAVNIRGQITWFDSMDGIGNSGMFNIGTSLVTRGRLGRDHMLDDYSDIILQKQREIDLKVQAEWDEIRQAVLKKEAQEATKAANLERQDSLINEIDKNIDLTPRPDFDVRDYIKVERIRGSVIKPGIHRPGLSGAAPMVPEERDVEVGGDIDRDCDQVRAMIARFIQESEWSCDQFRWALRGVARPQFISFLQKRGPSAGKQSNVFQLAWEFFKKRELLGYPMTNTPDDAGVLRERDGNRRTKRPSTEGKERTRGKRTRRT